MKTLTKESGRGQAKKWTGRQRETFSVVGMTWQDVRDRFNCPGPTAKDAVKRGYFIVGYKHRTIIPGQIDPKKAYSMAWSIYYKKFKQRIPWQIESMDLVQEGVGVARLLELGGHPRMAEKKFQFYTCYNGMISYIKRNSRHEHDPYEDDYRPDAQQAWLANGA